VHLSKPDPRLFCASTPFLKFRTHGSKHRLTPFEALGGLRLELELELELESRLGLGLG